MATDIDFINFVCDSVRTAGDISFKKMFGEYMVYCDARPVLLVCDNTVYVKQLPETLYVFEQYGAAPESGQPYKGAKPHYILDMEDPSLATEMTGTLARVTKIPKPKKKKPAK
ncbi:MAG: TfoX/Sxy family protein [Alphaproteobacteria bacterium]|nr:TfoX/Sxy family protein [Alphaproteobacteria bacterium]